MQILRSAAKMLLSHRPAVVCDQGVARYSDLLRSAIALARSLPRNAQPGNVVVHLRDGPSHTGTEGEGPRVAILAEPGRAYVEATWATWLAGGIAVPLSASYPARELQYFIEDSQASTLLTTSQHASLLAPETHFASAKVLVLKSGASQMPACHRGYGVSNGKPVVEEPISRSGRKDTRDFASVSPALEEVGWQDWMGRAADNQGALIIYTSGTTGRPKGALHTHGSLAAQVSCLCGAWGWQQEDRILHCLPLHHTHGIVNALHCAHNAGACVDFLPKFSPAQVWQRLMREADPVTVFMGVPTMYAYMLQHWKQMPPAEQQRARAAASRLRLAVSGSAACPIPIMNEWERLTGTRLLERYGMTESGMVLSNPLHGERRPGYVGLPLPGVQVKSAASPGEDSGELLVKGPGLFREYWGRPDATAAAFDEQGWFRTGDTVRCEGDPPYWRILGRASSDIIKSGGYKISALEVENVLLEHPAIRECAVVGKPDKFAGEVVAVVAASVPDAAELDLEQLQEFLRHKLPAYQIPKVLKLVDQVPRNQMGKVNKQELVAHMFQSK